MKVIKTCSFDRSGEAVGRDETLIAINLTVQDATRVAAELNRNAGQSSPWFYESVPDDYELKTFSP